MTKEKMQNYVEANEGLDVLYWEDVLSKTDYTKFKLELLAKICESLKESVKE